MPAKSNTPPTCLMTYEEVSAVLRLSVRTLRALVSASEIPVVRFGRQVRFEPHAIRAYIEANRVSF